MRQADEPGRGDAGSGVRQVLSSQSQGGYPMTPREERLLSLEQRAEKRRKRRKVMWHIAAGFNKHERAAYWLRLMREADRLETRLWMARVEAGTVRWAADDRNQRFVAVAK
jgi:hypothetical protein